MMGLSQNIREALGLTLLDSLWQGAIILLLCTVLLALLRSRAARWRYRLVMLGMLALPVTGIFTFAHHYQPEPVLSETWDGWQAEGQVVVNATTEQAIVETPGIMLRWQMWAQQNAHWVVTAWGIGLLLFALRLAGGFYMIRSLKSSAVPVTEPQWQQRLVELTDSLQIKWPVQIKESAKVSSPIVIGYLKPLIIFPLGLIQGISTDQVEAILLHELAHIKRQDYLVNLLVSLLQVVYFYHPTYWWLQQQLDAEREYSCDDLVLGHINRLSLVKALTAVKEFQMNSYAPVLGFAGHKNQLLKRVERIMKKKTRTNWLGSLLSMTALLLSFFLMSYQSVNTDEQAQAEPEDYRIIPTAVPFLVIPPDTITMEQAIMQLLDPKENEIILELDGKGRLVDLTLNGEPIGQTELKIYQQAHAKLRNYRYGDSQLENEKEAYLKEYVQKLRETEQAYKLQSEALRARERALNEQMNAQELRQKVKQYELMLLELKAAEAKKKDSQVSRNLDELLYLYPTLIKEYKEGKYRKWTDRDSLMFTIYPSASSKRQENYKFKITIEQLRNRLLELEKNGQPLIAPKADNVPQGLVEEHVLDSALIAEQVKLEVLEMRAAESALIREEIEKLKSELDRRMAQLKANGYVSPRSMEFTDNERAQKVAMEVLAKTSQSKEKPLMVVDGEAKPGWTIQDLNKIDRSRTIKSIDAIRVEKVTEEKYLEHMEGRDYLFKVTTAPGGKKYNRPDIEIGVVLGPKEIKARNEEHFTKVMLDKLAAEALTPDGWNSLTLSTESLEIDGKKQSRKVHKQILKLYQEIMGNKLPKGKTIELQE